MFGDILEAMIARTIVKAHGRTWMRVKDVPGDDPPLVLAIECTETGGVKLPAVVHVVRPDEDKP